MNIFNKVLRETFKFTPSQTEDERYEENNKLVADKVAKYVKRGSKGNLYLNDIKFTTIPDTLKVVNGNFSAFLSMLKKLPDNLTVNGYINIQGTPITKLPDNLTVNGPLNIFNTQVDAIPKNLTVTGILILCFTPLELELVKLFNEKNGEDKIKSLFPNVNKIEIYNPKLGKIVDL